MKDYKSISEKQKKLIEVLIKLVRLWHGMGMSEEQEERMWNIYNTMSPEMQKINSIIAELEQQEKCYPSDEEIEMWASGEVNNIDPNEYGYGDLLIYGAKWCRDYRSK